MKHITSDDFDIAMTQWRMDWLDSESYKALLKTDKLRWYYRIPGRLLVYSGLFVLWCTLMYGIELLFRWIG